MYYVSKQMEIAGSHKLNLPYKSKCSNLHGHNWIVTVFCKSPVLTEYGMVVDFTWIKKYVHDVLDHTYLNEVLDINPTAENIAKWICDMINSVMDVGICYRVTVQESEGNTAMYEVDNEGC